MPNYAELQGDPTKMVELMTNNIVKTGFLKNSTTYGRPERLKFFPDQQFKGVKNAGSADTEVPVLNLKQAPTGDMDSVLCYICDYVRGEMHYQVLNKEAAFCFTITMNGCTFGIGSPTAEGAVLVSHCNQAGAGEGPKIPTGSMAEKQATLLDGFHGPGLTMVTPDLYRTSGTENSTTFGIRTGGTWKFYYHTYKVDGSKILRHLGCTAVDGTTVTL